jgi:hypothetical protein
MARNAIIRIIFSGAEKKTKRNGGVLPFAEKLILFRLLKNAQMQGSRNPEE